MKGIMLAIIVLLVVGCSVNPSKIEDSSAVEYAKKVTYVRDDRTGICFAILASRKTMDTNQTGFGVTAVDCDACAELLVNKF